MLTQKLWLALGTPAVGHPLFHRMTSSYTISCRFERALKFVSWWGIVLGFLIVVGMWIFPDNKILPQMLVMMLTTPFIFVSVSSTIFGMIWAVSISLTIMKEKALGLYELLSASPTGPLGTSWMMCTGCLNRNQVFHLAQVQRNSIIGQLIIPAATIITLGIMIDKSNVEQSLSFSQFFLLIVNHALIIAVLFIDYRHSMVLCSVIGMFVPNYSRSPFEAIVLSSVGFLALQVTSYMLVGYFGVIILPELFSVCHFTGELAEFSLAFLRLAVFYAIRAGMIALLWNVLIRSLNADVDELEAVTRPV